MKGFTVTSTLPCNTCCNVLGLCGLQSSSLRRASTLPCISSVALEGEVSSLVKKGGGCVFELTNSSLDGFQYDL